jgi:hypothetical protein
MSHVCYHCKELIPDNVEHDCWTTTERELTKGLSEDLRDAWERIRETALEFGEQRVYASHSSIMFSRKACQLVVFLGRAVKSPLVRKVVASSKTKRAHLISIVHRDQVEAPITDWMREAYGLEDQSNRRDRRDRRELTDRKPKKTKRKKSP